VSKLASLLFKYLHIGDTMIALGEPLHLVEAIFELIVDVIIRIGYISALVLG
jgi:hypothetical protein